MTLPVSGPLSMSQIAAEFGGVAPHSLSEYYGADSGVPSSGAISISNFYGKSSLFTLNITTSQVNLNIRSALIAAGWNQASGARVNITGPYINRINCGSVAYPKGLDLYIGAGAFVGSDGSAASLTTQTPISVTNDGTIAATGGSGGRGQSFYYNSGGVKYINGGNGGDGQRFANNSTVILNAAAGANGESINFDGFHTATAGKGGSGGSWGATGGTGFNGVDASGGIVQGSIAAQPGSGAGFAVYGSSYINWKKFGAVLGGIGG